MSIKGEYEGKNFYAWRWVGGGYNSCRADSMSEALRKATAMGEPEARRTVTLVPIPATILEGKAAEDFVALEAASWD